MFTDNLHIFSAFKPRDQIFLFLLNTDDGRELSNPNIAKLSFQAINISEHFNVNKQEGTSENSNHLFNHTVWQHEDQYTNVVISPNEAFASLFVRLKGDKEYLLVLSLQLALSKYQHENNLRDSVSPLTPPNIWTNTDTVNTVRNK